MSSWVKSRMKVERSCHALSDIYDGNCDVTRARCSRYELDTNLSGPKLQGAPQLVPGNWHVRQQAIILFVRG